jgi:hypothetical protein
VVHSAAPEIEETLKWGIPHFMHDGIVCSMAAFKQHCTFGFWKHALVVKDGGEHSGGAMGSFGRVTGLSDLPSRKVLAGYVREAAGGRRALRAQPALQVRGVDRRGEAGRHARAPTRDCSRVDRGRQDAELEVPEVLSGLVALPRSAILSHRSAGPRRSLP